MIENLCKGLEELKRVDHLVYVSLKYTRTVDVIKSAIERIINALDFGINSLLEYQKEKKKIKEYPSNLGLKCDFAKKQFEGNQELLDYIQLYIFLRKVSKAEYTKREEYRKHVTLIASTDGGEIVEVDIEVLKGYYAKAKSFIELVKNIIEEKKEE